MEAIQNTNQEMQYGERDLVNRKEIMGSAGIRKYFVNT